jgi:hypothetical protein
VIGVGTRFPCSLTKIEGSVGSELRNVTTLAGLGCGASQRRNFGRSFGLESRNLSSLLLACCRRWILVLFLDLLIRTPPQEEYASQNLC